jgi:type IV fimbrial biogenesis protein FimT
MSKTAQHGFTLWELLITVVVAGVVLGIGVPSLMDFQRNNAIVAAANQYLTGTLLARTEAVKRQRPVTICASANPTAANPTCTADGEGTNGGFIVWVDDTGNVDPDTGAPITTDATDGNAVVDAGENVILMRSTAPGGAVQVAGDFGYVTYGPNGYARRARGLGYGPATRIVFCDDRGIGETSGGISMARVLRIDALGRGQILSEVADVKAGIAAVADAGVDVGCAAE